MVNEMNKYELMLILNPDLNPKDREEVVGAVKKLLEDAEVGKFKEQLLGKKKLAYKIDDLTTGDYMVYNFESNPESLTGFEDKLNIMQGVVRYMVTKR